MTENADPRRSVAQVYDASKPALDAALKAYNAQVCTLVAPVAGEHYVVGRVKTRRSLIRKLAKDGSEVLRGWNEITDKVGLRVIVSTKRDRKAVARVLEQHGWTSCAREDKRARTKMLEYTGVHVTVHDGCQVDSQGGPILCEIQIRTRAQDAWSVVSHKLTYKGLIKLPSSAERVVWRLSVLAEIFDDDIQRMFKKRESMPAFEMARALEYLDDKYGEVLGEPGQGPGDLDIMSVLWEAYSPEERANFRDLIDSFLADHSDLSSQIVERQPGSAAYMESRDWLSTQPEVIAILERAMANEHMLAHAASGSELDDSIHKLCGSYGIYLPE